MIGNIKGRFLGYKFLAVNTEAFIGILLFGKFYPHLVLSTLAD